MVKHRGGRGRAKRRRCAFVVREECGNVPAPCQTSLKEVRPHSAGVGKPGEDGAHTGERGSKLHRPLRGYVEERKQRGERRKSKGEAWFRRPVSRVCLCPMTSLPSSLPPSHPTPPPSKCSESACVRVFAKHSTSSLVPSVSAWTGVV